MSRSFALLISLLLAAPAPVLAQVYPSRPVELVVPFPEGGRADLVARQWAEVASRHLGQPIVVVNNAGDAGAVGSAYVMNAPADGYTLMLSTVGNQVLRPMSGAVSYRYDSFAPIGRLSVSILVLASRSDRPWKSLKDLAEDARNRPGAITFTATPRLFPHLTLVRFAEAARIDLRLVPKDGDATAIAATLDGDADLVIASLGPMLEHVKAGALQPLGVFSRRRDPALGRVATATEQGFAVVGEPWAGIVGPKGMSPEVLARLREVFALTVRDAAFVQPLVQQGERVMPLGAEAFERSWKQDADALGPLIGALE